VYARTEVFGDVRVSLVLTLKIYRAYFCIQFLYSYIFEHFYCIFYGKRIMYLGSELTKKVSNIKDCLISVYAELLSSILYI